jgi:hypothetical protein
MKSQEKLYGLRHVETQQMVYTDEHFFPTMSPFLSFLWTTEEMAIANRVAQEWLEELGQLEVVELVPTKLAAQ